MRKNKTVKLLIIYKSGLSQITTIIIKNDKDLERFKQLEFTNVINMKEI